MKNTRCDVSFQDWLSREPQIRRMRRIIRQELTPLQRQALVAVYFENKTLTQFARERNVNKSTIWRTLRRAENKLRRYMA